MSETHLSIVSESRDYLLPSLQTPCLKVHIEVVDFSTARNLYHASNNMMEKHGPGKAHGTLWTTVELLNNSGRSSATHKNQVSIDVMCSWSTIFLNDWWRKEMINFIYYVFSSMADEASDECEIVVDMSGHCSSVGKKWLQLSQNLHGCFLLQDQINPEDLHAISTWLWRKVFKRSAWLCCLLQVRASWLFNSYVKKKNGYIRARHECQQRHPAQRCRIFQILLLRCCHRCTRHSRRRKWCRALAAAWSSPQSGWSLYSQAPYSP